jgi:hypothetical protein
VFAGESLGKPDILISTNFPQDISIVNCFGECGNQILLAILSLSDYERTLPASSPSLDGVTGLLGVQIF